MKKPKSSKFPKKINSLWAAIIFAVIFVGLSVIYALTDPAAVGLKPQIQEVPITQIISLAKEGKIDGVKINGSVLEVTLKDGSIIKAIKEPEDSLLNTLAAYNIDITQVSQGITAKDLNTPGLADIIIGLSPIIIAAIFIFFIMRQARGVGNDIFAFGKSRARLFSKDTPQITFADAAGVDEAKQELREIVDFLKNPQKYRALGARVPKGVLLVGPAGTGKTLLARAVAGEAGVPFFSMAGSEFMEMLVGVGSARVRDLFANAKTSAPSIIFIDEIEAIGRHRGSGFGGQAEQEQTLNQILVEMDGFDQTTSVIVLAATNRPELLDPALVRPGRFDRRVVLDLPDIEGRKEIINIHMRGKPFTKGVNVEKVAQRTVGFSGADLENMLNESAILAARNGRKEITTNDLEEAALKVELGPERRRLQSDAERSMSAYHEAGHAIVSHFLPHTDPIHRVSIVSRGMALGYTMITPIKDRYNQTKTELLERIAALLGGRASEELIFNDMTVGAGNDLERANTLARAMVYDFGMSNLGPLAFTNRRPITEWPYQPMEETVRVSNEMAQKIDSEVKEIIDESFERAKKILLENRDKLDQIARILMKNETIEEAEFAKVMAETISHVPTPSQS